MVTKQEQSKHWKSKDLRVIQSYWDSPPATLRSRWLVEQLHKYQFESIFEVGYFAGRNIKHVKEAFPNVDISGLEINPKASKFARDKLQMPYLLCMDAHDMHNINDQYDIVFTSGMLIHVPPNDIPELLKKMHKITSKYLMHIESIGNNEVVAGPKHLKPSYKVSDQLQFAPDLISIYKKMKLNPQVIELPENCRTNGASELIIIKV